MKNRIKIRDSMLTWLKRVTDFRSHAKGHTILCDVYYQPTNEWSDERFSKSTSLVCDELSIFWPPDWSKISCTSCFQRTAVTCCDFISIHGRILAQSLSKRMFVFWTFWLKIMDFVTQTAAKEVGNNFPCRKNVLQAMVSNPFMENISFSLTTVCKPSNLH